MATVTFLRAETPLIVSLDIGTSSIRASLFDRMGRAVEGLMARRGLEIQTRSEGAAEADPDSILRSLFECLDQLMERIRPLKSGLGGVAACTFVNNILGIDETHRAVTPLTTYADTRAEREVAGLQSDFDESSVHDRTGCRFHPSYLPARFRWMARARPEWVGKAARWVSIGEYLELKLFGEAAVSHSVASWTGLQDRFRLVWDESLLAGLPIGSDKLSPLTDVNRPRRGLRPEFAGRWPELAEVPWFPAVGDGAAANVGSGCISSGQVAVTMGTTSAVRVVLFDPPQHLPPGLWCYRVDGKRSLLGGALSEGGSVFAWMRETLNLGAFRDLEGALAALEPDSHGLTVLPFLAGERAPGWAGQARGAIQGLSLATTPLEILRAAMESVAYRLFLVFELLRPLVPGEPRVVASGGALLGSPAWLQIVADVLGRPVHVCEEAEATSRGAALLALESLGAIRSLEEIPHFIRPGCQADPHRHARYQKAMERQKELYQMLIESKKFDYRNSKQIQKAHI
ncbi:MAG: gluconokinase [Syntrophaceae bacterium]|nr:gluconokinase [Syntrophaceae bacterium]